MPDPRNFELETLLGCIRHEEPAGPVLSDGTIGAPSLAYLDGHEAGWDAALIALAARAGASGWMVRAALRFALGRMGADS